MGKKKEEISVNEFRSRLRNGTVQWIYGEDIWQPGELGRNEIECAMEQESEDLWYGENFSGDGDYRGAWGVVRLTLEGFVFDVDFYMVCNLDTGWVSDADFDARVDVVTWNRADAIIVDDNGCEINARSDNALEILGIYGLGDDPCEFVRSSGIEELDSLKKVEMAIKEED